MDDPFRDPFGYVFCILERICNWLHDFILLLIFSDNNAMQGPGNARLVMADPEENVHNSAVGFPLN